MRIFVAGATGVLGSRIVPLLVAAGHTAAERTVAALDAPSGVITIVDDGSGPGSTSAE